MEQMQAYDVAKHVATERGWACRPQQFGPDQARLLVEAEERWLGVTTVSGDLVYLHAGHIHSGSRPVDLLWLTLDKNRG
ncbi:hypothetical protein ACFU9B_44420 [Streptomyces sp. NPDC057592]|uniref:hypothetical protein n=1 Tax=unclassified Streptomyces TaxID=2593676 RepID=UPI0036CA1292